MERYCELSIERQHVPMQLLPICYITSLGNLHYLYHNHSAYNINIFNFNGFFYNHNPNYDNTKHISFFSLLLFRRLFLFMFISFPGPKHNKHIHILQCCSTR